MTEKQKCRADVHRGYHSSPCLRNAWKDGYCKQHHPDTVAARDAAAKKRFDAKWANHPIARLGKAQARISTLEAEVAELRERLASAVFEHKIPAGPPEAEGE